MKLLLDEGLPYRAAQMLTDAGNDSRHVYDLGLSGASDQRLVRVAIEQSRVIVTCDSDFHAILARSGATEPSVIRLRLEGLQAGPATTVIIAVIEQCITELTAGAAVSVTAQSIRIRMLPL